MGFQQRNLKDLTIGIWNANGLKGKIHEARDFCTAYNLDLFLVQETHFSPGNLSKIANYDLYNDDRPRISNHTSGGTAIYVRQSIPHCRIQPPRLQAGEATVIQLNLPENHVITIASVYLAPRLATGLIIKDLTTLFKISPHVIVAGDFNAKHQAWGCPASNSRGFAVKKWADENYFDVVSPGSPTRFNNVIDFAITSNIPYTYHMEVTNELPSDHLPILYTLELNHFSLQFPAKLKTDWEKFKNLLNRNSPPRLNLADWTMDTADAEVAQLESILRETYSASSRPRSSKANYYKLPPGIQDMIRNRNRLRKDWQASRDPELKRELNFLKAQVSSRIKAFVNARWNTYIESLSTQDNTIWRATSRIRRHKTYIPTLKGPNGRAISNTQKAELLADSLRSQFEPHHTVINPATVAIVNPMVEQFISTPSPNTLRVVKHSDITPYIRKLKKKKAPGRDLISTNMIKCLPRFYISYLTYLFNHLLNLNYFPRAWKVATVAPLPKPNLDHSEPSNYRPISLLSCISKLFEYVLAQRLDELYDLKNIPIPEQYGFRRKHSTQHQLLRVVELIHDAKAKRLKTTIVFLDIQKAFDKVWINGLLFKLIALHFPAQLIKILHSYLTERSFAVRVSNFLSSPRNILSGVPQGSLIGPKLFNLYINDLPRSPGVTLGLYADDTALIAQHKQSQVVHDTLQSYLDSMAQWLTNWRIKVNVSKCAAVVFPSLRRPTNINLTLNNEPIPWQTSYKYLGVYLDSNLTWRLHISETCRKVRSALAQMRPLLAGNSRLSTNNKLLLYKSCIRPIMTYGSSIWGTAADFHLRKLQVAQNKALRSFIRFPSYVRLEILHRDLNIKPFLELIQKLAQNFFKDLSRVNNPTLDSIPGYNPAHPGARKRPRDLPDRTPMDMYFRPLKRARYT